MMFMYMKMLLKYMKMQFFRVILDIGAKYVPSPLHLHLHLLRLPLPLLRSFSFLCTLLLMHYRLTETHKTIFDGFYEVMCGDDALKFFSDLVFYSQYSMWRGEEEGERERRGKETNHQLDSKVFSLYGTQVLKMLLGFEFQSKTLLLRSMYKAHRMQSLFPSPPSRPLSCLPPSTLSL